MKRSAHGSTEALFALRQRLSDYPAAQFESALRSLMGWIAQAIDADNVIWIGAVRVLDGAPAKNDPSLGWRLRVRQPLRSDPGAYQRQLAEYYTPDHYGKRTPTYYQRSHEEKREVHVGMTGHAAFVGAGRFRVHRMRDGWIDFAAFRRTLNYQRYYLEPGISDRIWIGYPVTGSRESFFLVDRYRQAGARRARHFSLREATLAGDASRGVPELHRRLLLGHGLLTSDKPLSPVERQILRGLLSGRTEKEVAAAAGRKPATMHQYVKAIYRHFGVESRAALMALWLGELP